jgi:hypothetical protein
MLSEKDQTENTALTVIARSLAFLCLNAAELRGKEILPQARLLESLGLSRVEAAKMLDTTPETIRVGQHRASTRKGAKSGKNSKRARRRNRR